MISIVICSVDAKKFEAVCAHYRQLLGTEPHEIIGVHNAKSICEGYNTGFAKSRGDLIIFSHDDIEFLGRDFLGRLKGHLSRYDGIGLTGTNRMTGPGWLRSGPPHIFGQVTQMLPKNQGMGVYIYGIPGRVAENIQGMDGLFLAFRREVVERIGWDEKTFNGFHCYDTDMTFRAHLAGYRLAVVNDLPAFHASGGDHGENWRHYAQLFMEKHAGKVDVMTERPFQFMVVAVPTKAVALEVMAPGYLD